LLPLSRTTRAVITLVTLAMGRSVFIPRLHSTWPVAASARIAPLAFTPCGVPVTSISGPDGEWLGRGAGAGDPRASAAVAPPAARAPDPVSVTAHAVMPPPMTTAAVVSATIRPVSRMAWLAPATVDRQAWSAPTSRPAGGGRPHSPGPRRSPGAGQDRSFHHLG